MTYGAADVANYKGPTGQPIQPGAQAGDIKYADLNNDGVINDKDRYNAGNGIPKLQGGLFFDTRYGPYPVGQNSAVPMSQGQTIQVQVTGNGGLPAASSRPIRRCTAARSPSVISA